MQKIPVDSTGFASIGYRPDMQELDIEFRPSGDIYRYFNVPGEDYSVLKAAESKGTQLNQVFNPRAYRYELVYKGKKALS